MYLILSVRLNGSQGFSRRCRFEQCSCGLKVDVLVGVSEAVSANTSPALYRDVFPEQSKRKQMKQASPPPLGQTEPSGRGAVITRTI